METVSQARVANTLVPPECWLLFACAFVEEESYNIERTEEKLKVETNKKCHCSHSVLCMIFLFLYF